MRAVFSPYYSIELGPHHQFPMEKYRRVHERLVGDGTLPAKAVVAAEPISEEKLRLAHTADYVSRFIGGELTHAEQRKLGFSWSPELVRRALYATGGTLIAARLALEDGIAANLAGGSHHAFADHGEGYCAFNDIAVAVRALQEERPRRLAVIDCDVHQGNGTAAILREEPGVHTFSIHCQSNYPLEKVPGSRDVGLRDRMGDEEYLAILEVELDAIWREFRPQMVFYQSGVDPLATDRLGRLSLTRDGLRRRDALVLRRCLATDVPAVILMGGGYSRDVEETVEAHADTVRAGAALLQGAW